MNRTIEKIHQYQDWLKSDKSRMSLGKRAQIENELERLRGELFNSFKVEDLKVVEFMFRGELRKVYFRASSPLEVNIVIQTLIQQFKVYITSTKVSEVPTMMIL